jgi:hypothetical protein
VQEGLYPADWGEGVSFNSDVTYLDNEITAGNARPT